MDVLWIMWSISKLLFTSRAKGGDTMTLCKHCGKSIVSTVFHEWYHYASKNSKCIGKRKTYAEPKEVSR
jgi:hypothetical protein